MATAFSTCLQFGPARISVRMSLDFPHNSMTIDPYPHSHPKYEMHYILSGSCTLVTEKKQLHCPKGHFLLLPPRQEHRLLPNEEQVQTVSFLYAVDGADAEDIVLPVSAEPVLIRDEFQGKQRLLRIRSELLDRKTAYTEMVQGDLLALMAAFARYCGGEMQAEEKSLVDGRADTIGAYVANHRYDPDCSCTALAREMGLSTRQVHRLCMKYFDVPFRTLLSNVRMETAAYRLENTDISVRKLAAELGYASVESFSGAFRRHFGVAPTARRNNKKESGRK